MRNKKKFNYYLFYKDCHYLLIDREKNIIHQTISFISMYDFIIKSNILLNDINLKSLLLSGFFRDYVTFDEVEVTRI